MSDPSEQAHEANSAIFGILDAMSRHAAEQPGSPEASAARDDFERMAAYLVGSLPPGRADTAMFAIARMAMMMVNQLCDELEWDPLEVVQRFARTYENTRQAE